MDAVVTKKTFSRLKVLIVDDDPLLAEFLREGLKSHFSLIVVAASLEQAKSLVNGPFVFHAVVCDYQLTDGTGMDFYHWLRRDRQNDLPFLMISGKIDPIQVDDPAFGFLAKPFLPYDLLTRMEKLHLTEKAEVKS